MDATQQLEHVIRHNSSYRANPDNSYHYAYQRSVDRIMMVVFTVITVVASYMFSGVDGVLNFFLGICIGVVAIVLVPIFSLIFSNLFIDVRDWLQGW